MPRTSEFEYIEVTEGMWYRRGPPCPMCEAPGLQGVIFQNPTPDMLALGHDLAGREICATCGFNVEVGQYGEKQTGRVRILFPPDEDGVEENPYLNPLDRTQEPRDWKACFIDAGLHDIGNGRRFALKFAERVRHTAGWGWLVYDGRRWLRDDRGTMDRFAKAVVQEMRDMLLEPVWPYDTGKKDFSGHSFKCSSKGQLEAMLAMAASEPEIATGVEQFDQYPWLLNCRNGIVDLTTGALRPHDPELFLTQLIPFDFDANAQCPRWLQFLDEITCGDKELADYIHRAVGYTFTGETSEEKMFFMSGNGANGKSKFIGAIRHVLGDYGTSLSFEALLKSRNTTPEQGFAHLPGKRFATASEGGANRAWNEEALKAITGRDMLRGKQLYKDQFEFRPVVKLWVAANDQPRVDDYGEAMWRRLVTIPFRAFFEGASRDDGLEAKLQAEAKGILAWAVRGAMRWYREKLKVEPQVVRDARDEYKSDNDVIGRWITECCALGTYQCTSRELYNSFVAYAKDNNERELTQTAFGSALGKWRSGKVRKHRLAAGVVWKGLTLKGLVSVVPTTIDDLVGADSVAGPFDIDKLATGVTHSQHDRLRIVQELVRSLAKASEKGWASHEEVLQAGGRQGLAVDEIEKALETLRRNHSVYAKGGGGTYAPLNP